MNIVVIGGSAGAIPALKEILEGLPATLNSAIFIVIHFPEDKKSFLPQILNKTNGLPASHAANDTVIQKGQVYIAPPGFHLIIEKDKMLLSNGPKENRFRPSVDVLFRSAAIAYGPQVTGIVLSGALDDGTAGLLAIKKLGGKAIVQEPTEAIIDSMPLNALKYVSVDNCVPAAEMPALLTNVAGRKPKSITMKKDETIEWENSYAQGEVFDIQTIQKHADATRYICPLCDGPLFKLHDKEFGRYRCFTGHAFSGETLFAETNQKMEHLLWTAYRTLDEKKEMLKNIIKDGGKLLQEEQKIDIQLSVLAQLRQNLELDEDTEL